MKPELLIKFLKGFNDFLHVLMAIALAIASLMVVWESIQEFIVENQVHHLGLGFAFLHALATLFLVWTFSSLIAAEISYVQTGSIHLRVFVDVAMITLMRQIIIAPVKSAGSNLPSDEVFDPWQYGLLLLALLITGIVHKLVGDTEIEKAK
ncbi:hypothetical protein [Methylomonas albis]|uniref:Phosphate-starvation-inducible PsiE family protein n=1 Tax=Methylomonas albis TaxID=1854563 RepID=A0ABR9D727_9GAMM|nr:phosphate-starvation-inducible PsiE family protein [Methylomonas albis]MBD9358750.1 phosphate-starvation-inducible PsiE family protein [Methylomonas albis]CAD6882203.1 hypothetical protein [Methylomonas albis]